MYRSRIPRTIRTDTQGCGAGLADTNIDITLFDTQTQKTGIDHSDSLSLTCILCTSVFTFTHVTRFTHIYSNNTFSLYHPAWEYYLFQYTLLHSAEDK